MIIYLLINFLIFLIYTLEYIIGFPLLYICDLIYYGRREITKDFLKYLYIEYIEKPIEDVFHICKKPNKQSGILFTPKIDGIRGSGREKNDNNKIF